MNERFQALAHQAEDWADNQNFYESDYRDYLMEKFAELIVEECANLVNDNMDHYNGIAYIIPEEIKQHFGVE